MYILIMECKLRYFLSITILLLWSFCTVASANDDEVFIWGYYGGGAVCEGFVDSHKNDVNAIIPETVTDGGETCSVVGIGLSIKAITLQSGKSDLISIGAVSLKKNSLRLSRNKLSGLTRRGFL